MEGLLHDIIVGNLFALLLIFMRLGTALMVMPAFGDSFINPTTRLLFALAMSLVLTPVLSPHLPPMPSASGTLVFLLICEAFIGIFIGTIMRIMMSSLDAAGVLIGLATGYSSAQLFNPVTQTSGSIFGSVYSMLGITLIMAMNLHHYMLAAVVNSYDLFPSDGSLPDMESATKVIIQLVSLSFNVGIKMAMPFLIVSLIMQTGQGLLSRLMPQIQIYFVAMPLQLWVGLSMFMLLLSTTTMYWVSNYENAITHYLGH